MKAGTVRDVCKTAGMNDVCFSKDINHRENVKGCVTMADPKESFLGREVSTLVCGDSQVEKCQKLYGVFLEVQNWSYAPCGAMPERFCVARSGFISGQGSDYSKESKFYCFGAFSVAFGDGVDFCFDFITMFIESCVKDGVK